MILINCIFDVHPLTNLFSRCWLINRIKVIENNIFFFLYTSWSCNVHKLSSKVLFTPLSFLLCAHFTTPYMNIVMPRHMHILTTFRPLVYVVWCQKNHVKWWSNIFTTSKTAVEIFKDSLMKNRERGQMQWWWWWYWAGMLMCAHSHTIFT
jgi:hypothetical protein